MSRPYFHPNPVRGGGAEQYIGVDHALTEPWPEESYNVRLVAHSDLNGWGDAFQIQIGKGIRRTRGGELGAVDQSATATGLRGTSAAKWLPACSHHSSSKLGIAVSELMMKNIGQPLHSAR